MGRPKHDRAAAQPEAADPHPGHEDEAARLEDSLADLPEIAEAFREHVRRRQAIWGEDRVALTAYEAVNQVLWPYLERLLTRGGPDAELRRAFDFVERIASSSEFAESVIATELGWELWARRHNTPREDLNRAAQPHMGPKTAAAFAGQEALVRSIEASRWSNRLRRWLRSRVTPKDPKGSAQ